MMEPATESMLAIVHNLEAKLVAEVQKFWPQ
jgi:hypothetical protein